MRDDAVSSVIAVALMLAIVVSVASVVMIGLNNVDKGAAPKPNVTFSTDRSGSGGEVMIRSLGTIPLKAEQLAIMPTSCGLKDAAGNPKGMGELEAGDYVKCSADGDVVITDTASGHVLYRGTV